ncbi:MAG: insulinase family protein [Clostridiales bacterium]|nr:insulinase family protein [Clostridiales bacterium]
MKGAAFPLPGRKVLRFAVHYVLPLEGRVPRGLFLWPRMILRGSPSFPSRLHVERTLDDLEGASLWPSAGLKGQLAVVGLEGELLPSAAGSQLLHLLKGLLEEPLFPEAFLDVEKKRVLRDIKGLRDDKEAYLWYRLRERVARGEIWGLSLEAMAEEASRCTPEDLFTFHRRLLQDGRLFVGVAGEGAEAFLSSLQEILPPGSGDPWPPLRPLPPTVDPQEVDEALGGEEARLLMAYRAGVPWGSREGYVLRVIHHLLGSSPASRLFQVVREEKAWSYDVGSHLDRALSLLVLEAAVDEETLAHAQTAMADEVAALQEGAIDGKALTSALRLRREELRYEREEPSFLLDESLEAFLHGRTYRWEEEEEVLNTLELSELSGVAARLRLDTLYRLHPGGASP